MIPEEFRLDGKKALIAGDSKYWAKYAAAALAEGGAEIAIAGGSQQNVSEAASEAQRFGREALTINVDVTRESRVQSMAQEVLDRFGQIDILVNCDNIHFAKPFVEMTKDEWQKMLDYNLNSVFYTCQAVGREMLKRKNGRIINIISCLAARGMANSTACCASMGGVLQLTRAPAFEWARDGITVNAIGAGWIAENHNNSEPELLKYIPLKHYGNPL